MNKHQIIAQQIAAQDNGNEYDSPITDSIVACLIHSRGSDNPPACPICGEAHDERAYNEWTEVNYPCGHFVDDYNPDQDGGTLMDRIEAALLATHIVTVSHELGNDTEYYYGPTATDGVMTSSEIDDEYGLPEGTAKLAANRGAIQARKSAGTWLIGRSAALMKWGKPATMLMLAVGLAFWIAQLPI